MNLVLSRQQIVDMVEYRWPRICLNPDVWNIPKKLTKYNCGTWTEIKFERTNIPHFDTLDGQEGIYMFIAKPNDTPNPNHSFILYVGETGNLKTRFEKYFTYENTSHPSDQLKRRMVIVWKDYLYFQYIKTSFGITAKREELEYDLIDTIVPPMNDKFRSMPLKAHLKGLKHV